MARVIESYNGKQSIDLESRDGGIRTRDLLNPIQERKQLRYDNM
jgi:hypothetical protein